MGMSKIKVLGPGRVKAVHQLNSDGTAYAEDVTIESDVPGRLAWLEEHDGKVGIFSFSFRPDEHAPTGVLFPDGD